MNKIFILLLALSAASVNAVELNPIHDYSIDDLSKNSSAIVDGIVFHQVLSSTEEIDSVVVETYIAAFKVDAVIKNDTRTNIKDGKDGTVIELQYSTSSDPKYAHSMGASRVSINDKFRLYIPQYIRDVSKIVTISSKNQIHPELYGVDELSDSVSTGDISPHETGKSTAPLWYWLTAGVVSWLVVGGVAFRLGYLSGARNRKRRGRVESAD